MDLKQFLSSEYLVPIIAAVVVLLVLSIIRAGYLKASPDEAFIISGLRKNKKVLIGKAGLRIPFFEKKDVLKLQLIAIDVQTAQTVPTADYINIKVDANVNVQIGTEDKYIELAAQNFLNKKPDYIAGIAREVLEGNMREIVGKMALEEMVSDRQKFAELVRENADPDLAAMGLRIVSFNVQNFTDANGVIENLGVDNVVRIQKNAAISRAESEKAIAVAQAKAKSEANEAEVAAATEIAEREQSLAVKKSELQVITDKQKAIADASYKIAEQEQRKDIEIKQTEADIARQEKERELQERKAEVAEQELNATVRKQADADKYRREREAEASLIEQEKNAQADLVKCQKKAEAEKAMAEAARYAKEQEAAGIEAIGKAEAEAIRAKGEAEAAAMEKKADAYKKYGQAAITEMIMGALPEMAREVAQAVTKIDKVTIIDSGSNQGGVNSVAGWTPQLLTKTIEAVKETTGFDLTEVMKAGTYDAVVNRNLSVDGVNATECNRMCSGCGMSHSDDDGDEGENVARVEPPRFEGDHEHVYDKDGIPLHG